MVPHHQVVSYKIPQRQVTNDRVALITVNSASITLFETKARSVREFRLYNVSLLSVV